MQKVAEQLGLVVAQQPIHQADVAQATAAVEAFLAVIPEANETKDVYVSVSGSVSSYTRAPEEVVITSASVNVGVSLTAKEVKEA